MRRGSTTARAAAKAGSAAPSATTLRRAGKVVGALAAAGLLHKAFDKVQLLQVRSKARKIGVGEPRLDMKK